MATASAEDLLVAAEAMHRFDQQKVPPRVGIPVPLLVRDKDISPDTGEALYRHPLPAGGRRH